jgi:uncharacterized NAD(P)/FAD-binding protein YdhS
MTKRHAIVIGGGASGVLFAYQLLRRGSTAFRVTLIERRSEIGRGLAYHTGNPDHLLNVRAGNMSALPEDPDHFVRWLATRNLCSADPYCFVPRRVFGDYIESLIQPLIAEERGSRALTLVNDECVAISEGRNGVMIRLADGTRLSGDIAILATGHDSRHAPLACYADPWAPNAGGGIDGGSPLLILGTGLTMVDFVLSRLREGHRGPIVAISRRGLLSRTHRRIEPLRIDETEVPFATSASRLLRWLRDRVDAHCEEGGDWRSVIDGVRPFTQQLWRELPPRSRQRFLEHARAWWDVHRHRMAPEVEDRLTAAIADGSLSLIAAKIIDIAPHSDGARVTYRRRGRNEADSINVAAIVDCSGIVSDLGATTNPALRSLFAQGLARIDPLHIGLDVGPDGALIDRDGAPSDRLFAVGPLTRSAFWEIIAIPDSRSQCAELAAHLAQDYRATITPTSATQSPATVLVDSPIETAEISKYAKIIQAGAIA